MTRNIMICPGWSVNDVSSLEDCFAARKVLVTDIAAIEAQIVADKDCDDVDRGWLFRAKDALRFKRTALSILRVKEQEIRRAAPPSEAAQAREARKASFAGLLLRVLEERVGDVVFQECVLEARKRLEDAA